MKEFVEKLIERLEEELYLADKDKKEANVLQFDRAVGYGNGIAVALEIVNQLAEEYVPETNDGKWIPCSERLPEKEADVLLSLRNLDVYTGFRANTEGCFYTDGEGYVEFENVLAWQPLPEAYKPEQQKEIPTNYYTERSNRVM